MSTSNLHSKIFVLGSFLTLSGPLFNVLDIAKDTSASNNHITETTTVYTTAADNSQLIFLEELIKSSKEENDQLLARISNSTTYQELIDQLRNTTDVLEKDNEGLKLSLDLMQAELVSLKILNNLTVTEKYEANIDCMIKINETMLEISNVTTLYNNANAELKQTMQHYGTTQNLVKDLQMELNETTMKYTHLLNQTLNKQYNNEFNLSLCNANLENATSQLEKYFAQINTTTSELNECFSSLSNCTDSYKKSLNITTLQLDVCNKNLDNITSELNRCNIDLNCTDVELSENVRKYNLSFVELVKCQTDFSSLSNIYNSTVSEHNECTNNFTNALLQVNICTTDLTNAQSEVDACNNNLTEALSAVNTCTSNFTDALSAVNTCTGNLNNAVSEVNNCTSNLTNKVADFDSCYNDLTQISNQHDTLKQDYNSTATELSNCTNLLTSYINITSVKGTELQTCTNNLQSVTAELVKSQTDLSSLSNLYNSTVSEHNECKNNFTNALLQVNICTTDLTNAQSEVDACNNNLTDALLAVNTCTSNFMDAVVEVNTCTTNLKNAVSEVNNCTSNLTNAMIEYFTCNSNLTIAVEKINACTSNLTNKMADFHACSSDLTQISNQHDTIKQDYNSIATELSNCTSLLTTYSNITSVKETMLQTCANNLQSVTTELVKSQTDFLSLTNLYNSTVSENSDCINNFTNALLQVNICTTDLTNAQSEVDACNNNLTDAVSAVNTCTSNFTDALSAVNTCTGNLNNAVSEVNNCTSNLTNKVADINTCYNDLTQISNQHDTLKQDYNSTATELSNCTSLLTTYSNITSVKGIMLQTCANNLQSVTAELVKSLTDLSSLSYVYNSTVSEHNECTNNFTNALLQIKICTTNSTNAQSEVDACNNNLTEALSAVKICTSNFTDALSAVNTCTSNLNNAVSELNNCTSNLTNKVADFDTCYNDLTQITNQHNSMKQNFNLTTTELLNCTDLLTSYMNTTSVEETELQICANNLQNVTAEYAKIHSDYENCSLSLMQFSQNISEQNITILQLDVCNKNQENITIELDKCYVDLNSSDAELNENAGKYNLSFGKLVNCQIDSLSLTNLYNSTVSELNECTSNLTNVLSQVYMCTTYLTNVQSEVDACNNNLTNAVSEVNTYSSNFTNVLSDFDDCTRNLTNVWTEVGTCTSDLTDAVEEVNTCSSNLTNVVAEVNTCTSNLTNKVEDFNTCSSDLTQISNQHDTIQQDYNSTATELSNCTNLLTTYISTSSVKGTELQTCANNLQSVTAEFVKFHNDYENCALSLIQLNQSVSEQSIQSVVCTQQEVDEMWGEIQSPKYPDYYPSNSNESWNITVPSGMIIQLTFVCTFDVQLCCDYLKIYDVNEEGNTSLIKELTGDVLPSTVYSTGNTLLLYFYSDNITEGAGWSLWWGAMDPDNKPSTMTVNSISLYVNNGYNAGDWKSHTFCDDFQVATEFQMRYDDRSGLFYDERGVDALFLYCRLPDGIARPEMNYADYTIIESDSDNGQYGNMQVGDVAGCSTDYYMVAFNQRVDSNPNVAGVTNYMFRCRGPGLYGTNYEDVYGYGIDKWGDYDVLPSSECAPGSAICGMQPRFQHGDLVWVDDVALADMRFWCCTVTLKKDSNVNNLSKGVSEQSTPSNQIGLQEDYEMWGEIESPNYPGYYSNNSNESWNITVPPGMIIQLTFVCTFDVQFCCDYLKIYDVSDEGSESLIAELTGDILPATLYSAGNKLRLHFYSDSITEGPGWSLWWGAMEPDNRPTCTMEVSSIYIHVNNGYDAGEWKNPTFCDDYQVVTAFQMRYEDISGLLYDERGVDALFLYCRLPDGIARPELNNSDYTIIESESDNGQYGGMKVGHLAGCSTDYYMVAFNQRVDYNQYVAGVTNYMFRCRGPGLYGTNYEDVNGYGLDTWGEYDVSPSSECALGSAICGMQPRFQHHQGDGLFQEDVALADMRFWCCAVTLKQDSNVT